VQQSAVVKSGNCSHESKKRQQKTAKKQKKKQLLIAEKLKNAPKQRLKQLTD